MLYRTLGKTGLKVSVVGIETHQWSGMGGRLFTVADIRAILKKASRMGINFIDTGECYFFHASERLIGEALGKDRKKFIIATKFGHESFPGEVKSIWSLEEIQKQLERSLAALQTDYIDIYQLHVNSQEDVKQITKHAEDVKKFLKDAKRSGKVRHIGIVLGDDSFLDKEAKILSFVLRYFPIETVQVLYNRLDDEAEKKIFPIAKARNLGIIVRVPLAKGYLSSRFKPTNKNYDKKRMALAEKIKLEELPKGKDLAEWAIGWTLRGGKVATVIPGCTAIDQLDSTVRAVESIA